MPKQGPRDGSLSAMTARLFSFANACPSPTVVVVFPSPAGVGLIAVTSTSFPSGWFLMRFRRDSEIFALYFPYKSRSSPSIPSVSATLTIGTSSASCAISISVFISSTMPFYCCKPYSPARYCSNCSAFISTFLGFVPSSSPTTPASAS